MKSGAPQAPKAGPDPTVTGKPPSATRDAGPATLTFTIPLPASTNALYRNVPGKGRVKTGVYKSWVQEAFYTANESLGVEPFLAFFGEVEVELLAARPDKRRRDIDNLLKATLDLCKTLGVIEDDSFVRKVSAEWVDGGHFKGAIVTVRAA
ncbi:MAG: RusA family crossover junction endodeoxyribonuclease [Gammaproteobacteria bacterium]